MPPWAALECERTGWTFDRIPTETPSSAAASAARCPARPGPITSASGRGKAGASLWERVFQAQTDNARGTRMDGDRQVVRTEPFVQASRVARELEPLDAAGAAAGMRGPLRPLDEERQARLRHRLGDACEPPAQVAAGALGDLQTE